MYVTPRVLFRSFCLVAFMLLMRERYGFAQNAADNLEDISTSLPDAPQPQESTKKNTSPLPTATATATSENITLRGTPKRFLNDQKVIWTSPLHIRPQDAMWLVPLIGSTATLINSDQHTMTSAIHLNTGEQKTASNVSTASVAALGAIPASTYLWSLFNYAPQAHETGLLAGEAVANGLVVNEALKLVFRRERPLVNNAKGNFFSSNITDSSFPSNHAVAAWSMAAVIGDEYRGWLPRTLVYGLASTVVFAPPAL